MLLTVEITECGKCRHVDHSGTFTVRGARRICGHSDACKARRSKTAFRKEYPEYAKDRYDKHWPHHWFHRIISPDGEAPWAKGKVPIPDWCPLKHGSAYLDLKNT